MKKLIMIAACLAWAGAARAQESQPLFTIERSKNANVVHYDARLSGGALDAEKPVDVYWVMLAEKGQREDLTWAERVKGYGFDIEPDEPGTYLMTLAPYKERKIKIYLRQGTARAELTIDGKPAFLEKLYINSTDRLVLPKVHSIELFGRDVQTGEGRHEKILPK